jgi:hypothetical protein
MIAPAMAFYGGLGDLLATVAIGDWTTVDELLIAVALDSWKRTWGTRPTGERNSGRRLAFSNGRLEDLPEPPPTRTWNFAAPFGTQDVVSLPLTETVTVSRHLPTSDRD